MRRFRYLALLLAACSAPEPSAKQAREPEVHEPAQAAPAAPASEASGPAISEAQARAILEGMFRDRGLRMVRDVEVAVGDRQLAVDGFDPRRRIGFEYTDPAELELQGDLAAVLDRGGDDDNGPKLLFLLPGDEASVRARAKSFLDSVLPSAPAK